MCYFLRTFLYAYLYMFIYDKHKIKKIDFKDILLKYI